MNPRHFTRSVRDTALRYSMDLSRPLVLVSGGPDSVALLRVVLELGAHPVVLHLDHGLRGDESTEDAEFVKRLCVELDVPFELQKLELAGGPGLQERAREERYRRAGEMVWQKGLSAVAAGHIADDVAETVLMNLARGAGLRGISGIPPVQGDIVRPMIERRRTEILEYLDALGQPYRTDPTNLTGKYARNRVRLEIMPVLEEFYPGAGGNIARGASLAREDLEALETLAARAIHRRREEVIIPIGELEGLPFALRRHAVREAYAGLAGHPGLDSDLVEKILELSWGEEGTRMLDLPGGIRASVRGGREISFYKDSEASKKEVELHAGKTFFEDWEIGVQQVRGYDPQDAAREEVAYLREEGGPYRTRHVREGDVVRPLGLGGSKKVMKSLKDRKVPRDLRPVTPVVVDEDERVAWVFCGELGEEFAVRGGELALRVEVRKAMRSLL